MELKHKIGAPVENRNKLLIVPYGIETLSFLFQSRNQIIF